MSEVLTEDEVAEVTGFKRAKQQKEWLIKNNWPFTEKRNGKPSVHRLVLRIKLGVPVKENSEADKEQEFVIDLSKVG